MVKQMGLKSANISAVINDQSLLKSIKLSVETDDADADADHMMALWCTEISELLAMLRADIGGNKPPDKPEPEAQDDTAFENTNEHEDGSVV